MSMEIEDLRRRLKKAERDLVNSKEECIHLTTNTQSLEREVLNFIKHNSSAGSFCALLLLVYCD